MDQRLSVLAGLLVGAGAMYFLDPDRGRRRRSTASDRFLHLSRTAGDAAGKTSRDLSNRVQGLVALSRSRLHPEPVDDLTLVERVRARLGRVVSHPGSIEVGADQGRVTLSGPILSHEADALVRATRAVAGVAGVEDRLERHGQAEHVPGLQGGRRVAGSWSDRLPSADTPAARVLTGMAGAALLLAGASRRDWLGASLGAVGLGLLGRGVANLDLQKLDLQNLDVKGLVGAATGRQTIEAVQTVTITAPVRQVYEAFSHYEHFPRFMSHVKEVRDLGDGHSHWVMEGPAGVAVEWDSELTRQKPERLLAWSSLAGAAVENSGELRFQENYDHSTRVTVRISYRPPGGELGHAVAALFGRDPKQQLDDDLARMKTFIETGVPPVDAAQSGGGAEPPAASSQSH